MSGDSGEVPAAPTVLDDEDVEAAEEDGVDVGEVIAWACADRNCRQ